MQIVVTRRDGSEHVIRFDDDDAELALAHRWCVVKRSSGVFYAATNVPKSTGGYSTLLMHRLLMGVADVDHKNRDGLDNRRANLRLATRGQQLANRRSWGRSRFKGVHPSREKWRAQIVVNGERHELGRFDTEEEAAAAYAAAARHAWGEYSDMSDLGVCS